MPADHAEGVCPNDGINWTCAHVQAAEPWVDPYRRVQDFLDSCSDIEKRVTLVRLAMKINNGDQHFDHGEPGYSWLCHRCALDGGGGLNGWVGALRMIGTLAAPLDGDTNG